MSQSGSEKPTSQIVLYRAGDDQSQIKVRLAHESVWLTQAGMVDLYQTSKPNISMHLRNLFKEGELDEDSVVKKSLTTAADGKKYRTKFYNLDAIIAVGYRVRSPHGIQFRQWATARLSEFLVKGFVLDDDRLKGGAGLVDYFDELLARIREIRASEARVYQRIREIFALACDYREGDKETQIFFATVQNKMHFAATGMTAAEIVRRRADASNPNMGLTAWKGQLARKQDVVTAKNYLGPEDIDTLNRITVMFLDQAEFRAQRGQNVYMSDWEMSLDKFLKDLDLPVLAHAGSVRHEDAALWAKEQYAAFADRRRLEAESVAETRYVEDLRASAKMLEAGRKSSAIPMRTAKKPASQRKPRTEKGK